MTGTRVIHSILAALLGFSLGCGSAVPAPTTRNEDEGVTTHKARVAAYRARLGELDKKLDDQKAKAEKATGDDKTKLQAKQKDAVAKRDAAKKAIDELEQLGADGKLSSAAVAANTAAGAAIEELTKAVE